PGTQAAVFGRCLLPAGCRSVSQAADRILEGVTAERLRELDHDMQTLIRKQFTALVHVCMASSNFLKTLQLSMQQEAETFAGARLAGTADVAEMYLAQHGGAPD